MFESGQEFGACVQQLRQRDAQYRTLIEGSIQGVVIHVDGEIKLANSAAVRLLGYEDADLRGQSIWSFVVPEDQELVGMVPAGTPCTTPRIIEFRVRRSDGDIAWVKGIVSPAEWDGEPARLATVVDITERRRMELELHEARRVESIGRLAGGVAHEFNDMLTAILGQAELALHQAPVEERIAQALRAILRSARHAASVTQRLLAVGRRQFLQPRIANLNALVSALAPRLHDEVGAGITMEISLAPTLEAVHVDPAQFEQVLVRLAAHARDAMPGGGVVRVNTSMVTVDDAMARGHEGAQVGSHVRVSVSDSGAAMSEAMRLHAFEPFATRELVTGTGLELASAFGIVRQSGGWMSVDSAPGGGTTFSVYLPAIAAADAPTPFDGGESRAPRRDGARGARVHA